jgi:hypothetical protein
MLCNLLERGVECLGRSDQLLFEHGLTTGDHVLAGREREVILNAVYLTLNRREELCGNLYQALYVVV